MKKLIDAALVLLLIAALGTMVYLSRNDGSLFGSPTPTITPSATLTRTLTATLSPTTTASPTHTPTATATLSPTPSPSATPTQSVTPSASLAATQNAALIPVPDLVAAVLGRQQRVYSFWP